MRKAKNNDSLQRAANRKKTNPFFMANIKQENKGEK